LDLAAATTLLLGHVRLHDGVLEELAVLSLSADLYFLRVHLSSSRCRRKLRLAYVLRKRRLANLFVTYSVELSPERGLFVHRIQETFVVVEFVKVVRLFGCLVAFTLYLIKILPSS